MSHQILDRLEDIITTAEAAAKPLEMPPYRGQIFELFVTAHNEGLISEEAEVDLTADGICHHLAQRWGLKQAANEMLQNQANMTPEDFAKMRLLWSVMRMWMEWDYAWGRWDEFH